jgi:hypothetical protein
MALRAEELGHQAIGLNDANPNVTTEGGES